MRGGRAKSRAACNRQASGGGRGGLAEQPGRPGERAHVQALQLGAGGQAVVMSGLLAWVSTIRASSSASLHSRTWARVRSSRWGSGRARCPLFR
jgi:hypothetical protein